MVKKTIILILMMTMCLSIVSATTYYVNISHPSCSDTYNSSTASNINTPMCSFKRGIANISSGDILLIVGGEYNETDDLDEYNDTGAYAITNKRFNLLTTIKAYENDEPELSNRIGNFYTTGGTSWKNQSSTVAGLWNFSYTTSSSYLSVMRISTNEVLFIYSTYANVIDASLPEGCFYNTTSGVDKLWCRFDNTSFNPNNEYWYITRSPILSLTNVTNLQIINLTFRGGLKSIYIPTTGASSNISILNNNFVGATGTSGSVGTGIVDIRGASNVLIKDNYVEQLRSDVWDWTTTKSSPMEATAIRIENCGANINITGNTIYSIFNGIYETSNAYGVATNYEISHNNISNIMDDGIELENYGCGVHIHHNNVSDAFGSLSLIPFNSSCAITLVEYNLFNTNRYQLYSLPSTYYFGDGIKFKSNHDEYTAVNLNITHNTFIGKGFEANPTQYRTLRDVTTKDNLFYSPNATSRILDKTGLSTDNVLYDYNLYYHIDDNLFRYWNNDTRTTEYNLSQAIASSSWDGTWDTNSVESEPLFVSGSYQPVYNSPACNMSSTGGFVGALPCADAPVSDGSFDFVVFSGFSFSVLNNLDLVVRV